MSLYIIVGTLAGVVIGVTALAVFFYGAGKKAVEATNSGLQLKKTVEVHEREQEIANRPASNDVDELIKRL